MSSCTKWDCEETILRVHPYFRYEEGTVRHIGRNLVQPSESLLEKSCPTRSYALWGNNKKLRIHALLPRQVFDYHVLVNEDSVLMLRDTAVVNSVSDAVET